LRIYLELKESREVAEIESMINNQLKTIDLDYSHFYYYFKVQPIRVTLLEPGTFQRFTGEKVKSGANFAHMKPPHMNPAKQDIQRLLELSDALRK
jgi:hypothetical protein